MVKACSVVNCSNRYISKKIAESGVKKKYKAYKNIPFHSLPVEEDRRVKWIAFINRKPGTLPKKVYVCGDHFELGKKSNDKTHTDYIPTIAAKTKEKKSLESTTQSSSSSTSPRVSKAKLKTPSRSPSKLHSASSSLKRTMRHKKILMARLNNPTPRSKPKLEDTLPVIDNDDNENQDNDTAALKEKIKNLEEIILNKDKELSSSKRKINLLKHSNRHLKNRVEKLIKYNNITNLKLIETRKTIREHVFLVNNDTDKMKFYTGLPSFEIFDEIFNFVKDHVDRDENSIKLTHKQEFIIVLMRLRLGLLEQDLAYRFGVSQPTISRIINRWIGVMATRLEFLIHWPEREQLRKTMPGCFLDNFEKCAVILDCFEIFIEKPTDLTARAQTWSQYKHHNTVKVLLGMTPQGTISFISQPWGGRASDVHVTENSGLLKNLVPGDVVMADRGFTISDSVGLHCATLKIPEFTKGKSQLEKVSLDETRDLASVRIHVERIIGLLRNKYTLLQKIAPIKMLMLKADGTCILSEILIVCSALSNLNGPVVPFGLINL